ncbi:MAG: serine protease [Endomicrobia bacterium]|nr:serine protease [Endomicrobiia bacterium]
MKIFNIYLLFSFNIFIVGLTCEDNIRNSIVKIYTTYSEPNYYRPWQMRGPYETVGSGVIIEGKRILTNAHVISNATFIQVKRAGKVEKYIAKVEYIAHDCDLGVLSVEDERFFEGRYFLSFGDMPKLQDKVAVYGFPKGGEELCITEGVISRIEHRHYTHSRAFLLTCQMDAAINPGSSGGPVIKDGKIVGISFQAGSGENISYMIPVVVIKRFFRDIQDKKYDGVPDLCIKWQSLENPDIREKYKMKKDYTGILVSQVFSVSKIYDVLKPEDIILSIDGVKIGNDGSVEFRKGERTSFLYIIQNKLLGEKIKFELLRDGKIIYIDYILDTPVNIWRLVPNPEYDVQAIYYIFGGFVFVPLTYNLINEWDSYEAPVSYKYHYEYATPQRDKKQIIVLLRTLADDVNTGYQHYRDTIVTSVNGRQVSSIEELIKECEGSQQKYIVFHTENGEKIILDREKAINAKERILKKYKIPSDRNL